MPDRTEEPDEEFRLVAAVTDPAEARRLHAENVAAWDEAAADYSTRNEDRVRRLRAGESSVHPLERANLTRLEPLTDWCHEAVHLQCASGFDTLSLLNEGAHHVAGVDISPGHISNARWVTDALGWGDRAEWYLSDVLDTPHELDGRFDLVYTGMGALCWIFDLEAWAGVVARLLRPGGVLHVLDNHPMVWMWDDLSQDLRVYPGVSYFDQAGESTSWSPGYLPQLGGGLRRKHERSWTFADMLNPLIDAGLRIERLGEHREQYFDALPNLREAEKARVPFSFSLLARRAV
jgi:SAM-dependent methyltransferase